MKTKYRLIKTYDNNYQIQFKLFRLFWKNVIDEEGQNLRTNDITNAKHAISELRAAEEYKAPVIY